jgi:uncharacterized membrane protein YgcG
MCGLVQALDLTVDSSFTTDEDVDLVFSYAQLLGKCTVSETPIGFKIIAVASDGTTELSDNANGPWTTPTLNVTTLLPGQFIRFSPNDQINGSNVLVMNIKAFDGVGESLTRSVNIDILSIPDPITATSGTFIQPAIDPKVTEDEAYTFSFADLVTTLHVDDPDGQAFKLVITELLSGSLTTTSGAPITLPYDVVSGASFRWQAEGNAFTKIGEPAIAAFKTTAVNTVAPLDSTATVTLSTPVIGVADDMTGIDTTLDSFDAMPVTRGVSKTFTYDQLRAMAHGTNDVDRSGSLNMDISTAAQGCIFRLYDADDTLMQEIAVPPGLLGIQASWRLQIIAPATFPTGIHAIGRVYIFAVGAASPSPWRDVSLNVSANTGGSSSSSVGGGSGGGCGAGVSASFIVIGLLSLVSRRRKYVSCANPG